VTALLKVPADVPADLAPVIAECERVTRERARNFWYGLKLTPGPARGAMYVIYAWMREADDLADAEGFAPEERVRRIAAFRAATDAALAGTPEGKSADDEGALNLLLDVEGHGQNVELPSRLDLLYRLALLVAVDACRVDCHENTAALAGLHHIWISRYLQVGHRRDEDFILTWKL
jgi:hypothetical protein